MSDMIDRLNDLSREAGANAAQAIGSPAQLDVIEQRITWGVRRKRIRAGVFGAASVAAIGVAAVTVPPLFLDLEPAQPGVPTPEVVHSADGLTVYSTGEMEIVTARGAIVSIAAPEPSTFTAFSMPGTSKICASIDPYNFRTGWEFSEPNVRSLFGLARVQAVTPTGVQTVPESGTTVPWDREPTPIRLAIETDTGIAPHLSVRGYAVFWDAEGPLYYQTSLDAAPSVEIQGNDANRVALVTTKAVQVSQHRYWDHCPPRYKVPPDSSPELLTRYMVIDVFVNSRSGHATLIATHRSWVVVEAAS